MRDPETSLLMFKTDRIEFNFDIISISSFRHKTHPKSSVWNDVSGKELEVTHHHRKVQQGHRYKPTVMNGKTCRRKKAFCDWFSLDTMEKWRKKSDSSWNINRLIIRNGTTIQWCAATRPIMVEVIIIPSFVVFLLALWLSVFVQNCFKLFRQASGNEKRVFITYMHCQDLHDLHYDLNNVANVLWISEDNACLRMSS